VRGVVGTDREAASRGSGVALEGVTRSAEATPGASGAARAEGATEASAAAEAPATTRADQAGRGAEERLTGRHRAQTLAVLTEHPGFRRGERCSPMHLAKDLIKDSP